MHYGKVIAFDDNDLHIISSFNEISEIHGKTR
jgi:hypothetical protein